ncbi:MAG: dolichyl-phosphate-mannose--protein mannosyltransferase [Micrococcales bacterium]
MLANLTKVIYEPRLRAQFDRWYMWVILALAAALRLWNLGYPKALVFDETYYVKDALTLSMTGVERNWPENANAAFESGQYSGFLDTGSFVVHPPLGKWIIAAGMWLFGPGNSFGWRFSVAALSIAAVWLLMLIVRKLTGSTVWAALAGFFFAIDGIAVVLGRTGLLDGILMFFVLLAFWFLLRDRETSFGLIWNRPWLLAAGIALGAATAVKWNGLYFLAAVGLYVVISEIHFEDGEVDLLAFAKQAAAKFVILIPSAFIVYLLSWTGWLNTKVGYDRNWAEQAGNAWTGILAWVPTSLQSLWHYHVEAYNFHVGLRTPHSYQSNPLTWLFLTRPTSFFYQGYDNGANGCAAESGCSSAITALGNPVIWLPALAGVLFLIYVFIARREKAAGFILLGVAAGYLPWMLYLQRTVFQFYVIAFEPFVIMALVYAMAWIWRNISIERRGILLGVYSTLAFAALAFSLFFLNIWLGTWTPYWYWYLHMWIPSWI